MDQRAHLQRLSNVWIKNPIYFVTVCTEGRRAILNHPACAEEIRAAFGAASRLYGWSVGRFVVMPDHVHFFARPQPNAKTISAFLRDWKKWTAKRILAITGTRTPLWQPEFFDHILRSAASYAEKWEYVRMNPVRAGLVSRAEDWFHRGELESLTF